MTRSDFLVFGLPENTTEIAENLQELGFSVTVATLSQGVLRPLVELGPKVVVYCLGDFDPWAMLQHERKEVGERDAVLDLILSLNSQPLVPKIWVGVGVPDFPEGEQIVKGHGHVYFCWPLKAEDYSVLKNLRQAAS